MTDGATLPIKYQDAWVKLAANTQLDEAFNDQFDQVPEARQLTAKKAQQVRGQHAGDCMDRRRRT